ncbi:MAG TPA: MCP four helix bundle domain-containing protein, partial [Isosphaeraceae bacterium]|nr:MCP four helix bundle domain-containing protein [Isosphaeraceae bacterium]
MNAARWFKNLSTFAKLLVAFGLLAGVMAVQGWVAISELATIQKNTGDIYQKQLVPLAMLSEVDNDLQRIRQTSYKMFTPLPPEQVKAAVEDARKLDKDLLDRSSKFQATIRAEEVRAAFDHFGEEMKKYQDYREGKQYALVLKGDKEQAFQVALGGGPYYEVAYRAMQETLQAKQKVAHKYYQNSQAVYTWAW